MAKHQPLPVDPESTMGGVFQLPPPSNGKPEEPKRTLLPSKPALLALNRVAKHLDKLSSPEQQWIIASLGTLYPADAK